MVSLIKNGKGIVALIKCGRKVFKIHALLSSERKFLVRGIKNAKYGKFVDTLKTKESD